MWEICYPESLQTLNWENVDISTQCTCENNLTGFIDSTDIRPCIQAERKWDMLMEVILSITSSSYDLSVWITWNTLKKFHSPLGYLSPPSWIPNFNFTAMTRCDWLLMSILRQCSHLIGAKVSKLGSKIDDFLAQKKKFGVLLCLRTPNSTCEHAHDVRKWYVGFSLLIDGFSPLKHV